MCVYHKIKFARSVVFLAFPNFYFGENVTHVNLYTLHEKPVCRPGLSEINVTYIRRIMYISIYVLYITYTIDFLHFSVNRIWLIHLFADCECERNWFSRSYKIYSSVFMPIWRYLFLFLYFNHLVWVVLYFNN